MTHDGATHLLRIARLDTYLRAGFLFPRWLPDLILGHGYPVLNYYASSTYYLVEGLHLLGLNLYYSFIVAQIVLVYLAGVGMYLFARALFRDQFSQGSMIPALITAVAYVYAPYLLINIYVRGAVAELGAQMLLPWIFWSFRCIWRSTEPQHYVLLAIFALGGLAWTHTISLLIIPPLLLAYLLLLLLQTADYRRRIGWSLVAGIGAIGISAFYWLPLIVERQYISTVGFTISKTLMLPISFIDWTNFIDSGILYTFREDPPFLFGLLQVTGTVIGLCFLWRKRGELWFWAGILAVCLFMMTDWARPLWFSNEILPIIQFPWRLLAIMQVPIALLFGLPFNSVHRPWLRTLAALVLIGLLIRVHLPHLPWAYMLSDESNFGMAQNAYFEAERTYVVESGNMTTTVQEFRPKWSAQTLTLDPRSVPGPVTQLQVAPPPAQAIPNTTTLQLNAADPFQLQLTTTSETAFPLRFATFFFPGWTATLDQATELTPYPSTNLGLLTVDVPAGEHTLTIAWGGTAIAAWGGLISQVTLLGIVVWQGTRQGTRRNPRRWFSVIPLACLLVGLVATYRVPTPRSVEAEQGMELPGLALMGHQQPTVTPDGIQAQLYWLALENAPPPLALRWRLLDTAETIVAETVSLPFYDAYTTAQWARDTIVDDAYLIPVPTAVAPGRYRLVMQPIDPVSSAALTEDFLIVGTVTLPDRPPLKEPARRTAFRFENQIVLYGTDLDVTERLFGRNHYLADHPEILTVAAGKTLDFRLYWQTEQETNEPYVSFLHLTNYLGQPIAQYDHLPGPLFQPPAIWATYNQYRDKFLVEIPDDAESGLYWPNIGMYNWKVGSRISAYTLQGEMVGDHIKLPPVKVINGTIRSRGRASDIRFGTLAALEGFDIAGVPWVKEDKLVHSTPGEELRLTIYYHAHTASVDPLRRFIQLRDAADNILAQVDGEPQNGINPTWSWVPGEVIREEVVLPIPAETATGTYQLYLGFYQPTGDLERLPVVEKNNVELKNREVVLLEVNVTQPME